MLRSILRSLLCLCALASAVHAQVNVGIEVKKRSYIRYEPLLVTVSLTNLSGRDLLLQDGESQWFSFLVVQGDRDTVLSPRNPDYRLDPLELKIGETVKRTVDLNRLYPVSEYGIHRIRATIYVKELDKYFTSKTANVDITEGRTVWKQTVGVPEAMPNAGGMHEVSLLSAQGASHQYLYCRITDPSTGNVLCMYKLGHIIDNTQFQAQFDATNTLHVLQLVGPKTYNLSQVGVNGEMYGQWIYDAPKFKPMLRRDNTGNLDIVGATRRVEAAKNGPTPKLSDRPPGLPGAAKP
jgi:hypothetical protein